MTTPTLQERLTAQIERNERTLAAWRSPAPEPPAWLEDAEPACEAMIADLEQDEAMLLDWYFEQQMAAEQGLEEDYVEIIATMAGAWS